jgi:uncharacterized membrane protein/nitrite reductase/ring-hydroxylating ferredoxin subunit
MKALLQGKPLRHPLHPFLAHFPIGLFFFSCALDLASWLFRGAPGLVPGAFYAMALGVVCALVAAVPGFADYTSIRRDHPARRTATWHMLLNLAAVMLYAANLWLRQPVLDALRTPALPLLLSLAGVVLLSVSGYLGGVMIYDDGVAVGRHRRRTPTPEKTQHASLANAVAPERGELIFVGVADANAIGEQETLRVEVDGTVITIAKMDGQFFAFQEFCTHRFGPLSEGTLRDGQIECPWHRSCFDVRTGKPTSGPAKVDLKTYEVRIEANKICLGIRPGSNGNRLSACLGIAAMAGALSIL